MADTKISDLPALAVEPASDDKFAVVDTDAVATKRIDWSILKALFTTHALATAANDFLVASGAGVFVKKTLAETLTILGKAVASGLASLDDSSKVVQDPANATVTPTASKIPIADVNGKLDAWVTASGDLIVNTEQRVFHSRLGLPSSSGLALGLLLISNKAYFTYIGKTAIALTPKFVEFYVSTIGAGAQTAEVGLFSTPSAPNKASQSLTKLVATDTVDSLITLGVKRNTVAFATEIPAGTHLWAGIRTQMVTTQPTITSLIGDYNEGVILDTATAGALTGAGPWTGAIIAATTGAQGVNLKVTLD